MIYQMHLNPTAFKKVESGQKIYEVRVNDKKRQLVKPGDEIIFLNTQNSDLIVSTVVEDVIHFEDFLQMARALPADELGFEPSATISEILDVYNNLYTEEETKLFGVVAIKIHLKN